MLNKYFIDYHFCIWGWNVKSNIFTSSLNRREGCTVILICNLYLKPLFAKLTEVVTLLLDLCSGQRLCLHKVSWILDLWILLIGYWVSVHSSVFVHWFSVEFESSSLTCPWCSCPCPTCQVAAAPASCHRSNMVAQGAKVASAARLCFRIYSEGWMGWWVMLLEPKEFRVSVMLLQYACWSGRSFNPLDG